MAGLPSLIFSSEQKRTSHPFGRGSRIHHFRSFALTDLFRGQVWKQRRVVELESPNVEVAGSSLSWHKAYFSFLLFCVDLNRDPYRVTTLLIFFKKMLVFCSAVVEHMSPNIEVLGSSPNCFLLWLSIFRTADFLELPRRCNSYDLLVYRFSFNTCSLAVLLGSKQALLA